MEDFEVTIGDEVRVFEQYHPALAYIADKMAAWNNFTPEVAFTVVIRKIPGQTDNLKVSINDEFNISEHFG